MKRIRGISILTCVLVLTMFVSSAWSRKSDFNADCAVDLADAVMALQAAAGMEVEQIRPDYGTSGTDVSGDNKLGLEEAVHILYSLVNDNDLLIYEDDDKSRTISFIEPDDKDTHSNNFETAGDEDWFMFYGREDISYVIKIREPAERCNGIITLYDKNDNPIKPNEEGKYELNGEFYFIKVVNANPNDFGEDTAYQLCLHTPQGDCPPSPPVVGDTNDDTPPVTPPMGRIVGYVCDVYRDQTLIQGVNATITNIRTKVTNDIWYSDRLGIYYVFGLAKGEYTLAASADEYQGTSVEIEVETIIIRRDICLCPKDSDCPGNFDYVNLAESL